MESNRTRKPKATAQEPAEQPLPATFTRSQQNARLKRAGSAPVPLVYVVIVNWNGLQHTIACMASIQKQRYANVAAVIIDNGSAKDEARQLKERFPAAKVVANGENQGFARACNAGVRIAHEQGADFVLILNNDAVLRETTLSELTGHALAADDPGLWSPLILYSDSDRVWFGGGWYNLWLGLQGHRFKGKRLQDCQQAMPVQTSCLTGCALFASVHTLLRLGPFDEDYFVYMEDFDLSFRARLEHLPIRVVPSALVEHKKSATAGTEGSDKLSPLQAFHWGRGGILFARKRLRGVQRVAYLLGTLTLRLLQVVVYGESPFIVVSYLSGIRDGLRTPLRGLDVRR